MIKEFNATVRYLESVLESEIDEREFLRISGYSVPMFSRLFSILTDMSLSEYVRLRKLTRAAMDIREGQAKIIASRKIVDKILAEERPVYGISTGFGDFSTISISKDEREKLQRNLIRFLYHRLLRHKGFSYPVRIL